MKKIPQIRFPEFSGEWKEKRLGEVIEEIKSTENNDNFPLYSLIIGEGLVPKTEKYKRDFLVKDETNAYVSIYKNQFAYNPMNIRFGALARLKNVDKAKVSKYYNIFKCKKEFNPVFLEYFFLHPNRIKLYNKVAIGSLIEKRRIYFNDFLTLKMNLPTLAEQQKIAKFLSVVDEKIDITTKKIEKLKEYKKGLLQKLLNVKNGVPEFRFPKFSGDWVEKKLGEVLYEVKKEKIPKSKLTNYEVLSIKLHTKGLEKTGKKPNITEKGRPYFLVETGDILIGKQNFHNGSIGIVTDEYVNMVTSNAIFHLKEKGIEKKFIFYYLGRKDFYKRVEYLLGGTGQKEISKTEFFNLKIIIPPAIEEQQKIASFLSRIDEKIELNEQFLDKLKEYKRGLLQKMFV